MDAHCFPTRSYPNTDAQYGEAADAYPDTDAQYAGCDASNHQGPNTQDVSHSLGDPVAALCGGGEAALGPNYHQTLYPDAHCYNVDEQQQQQQQQYEGGIQGDNGYWYGQEGCLYGPSDHAHTASVPGSSWYSKYGDQGSGYAVQGGAEYAGTGTHTGYMGYGYTTEILACEGAGAGGATGDDGSGMASWSGRAQESRGQQEGNQSRCDQKQQGEKEEAAGLCGLLANYASDDDGGSGKEDNDG
eukprot:1136530-Pelagomonas_calceolata.AAC.1